MKEVNRDTAEGRDGIALFSMEYPEAVMVKSPREGNFAYLFENSTEYNLYLQKQNKAKQKRTEQQI